MFGARIECSVSQISFSCLIKFILCNIWMKLTSHPKSFKFDTIIQFLSFFSHVKASWIWWAWQLHESNLVTPIFTFIDNFDFAIQNCPQVWKNRCHGWKTMGGWTSSNVIRVNECLHRWSAITPAKKRVGKWENKLFFFQFHPFWWLTMKILPSMITKRWGWWKTISYCVRYGFSIIRYALDESLIDKNDLTNCDGNKNLLHLWLRTFNSFQIEVVCISRKEIRHKQTCVKTSSNTHLSNRKKRWSRHETLG